MIVHVCCPHQDLQAVCVHRLMVLIHVQFLIRAADLSHDAYSVPDALVPNRSHFSYSVSLKCRLYLQNLIKHILCIVEENALCQYIHRQSRTCGVIII